MKKLISTAFACIVAAMTISCSNGFSFANSDKNVDTISYIVGMNIANDIDGRIMPELKADYDVIIETLKSGLKGEKEFTVEDVTINKGNIQELGMKYLGAGIASKVQAAMADSTGMTEVFETPAEKKIVSTLLGANIAFSLENAPFEINIKQLMKAVNDIHNNTPELTEEKAEEFMTNYFTVILPAENDKLSKEWLAKVEKEKGVKKTESGILYKIVEEGDIRTTAVNDTDVVKVLYTGTTRKGDVFDSNRWADMPQQRKDMIMAYQPDQACDSPIEFPLNRVIPGWTEGMKLVGKGGRIILWIPSELAYGERGAGQNIGANEALCFDVELLDVRNAE